MTARLSPSDLEDLARAREQLENPGLAMRLAERAGAPVEVVLRRMPSRATRLVLAGTQKALDRTLSVALSSLDAATPGKARDWLHRAMVVGSGFAGGALGLPGLLLELPVTTALMLRSIADHARAQGEDLSLPEARLECLTVFAYGSRRSDEDPSQAHYYAVRSVLARLVADASQYVGERGIATALADHAAPSLARLVARVAERFSITVTDKVATQLVPLLGAMGGAAVNALFLEHYQSTASGHFTVRRLERKYGEDAVRAAYDAV